MSRDAWNMWDALDPSVMLSCELAQRREAGYDGRPVESVVRAVLDDGGSPADVEAATVRLELTSPLENWPFHEPSELDEIRRAQPVARSVPPFALTDGELATVGSIFGAMHGTDALPGHWVEPLNDVVRSSIIGFDHSSLSDLAERTFRLAVAEGKRGLATRVQSD